MENFDKTTYYPAQDDTELIAVITAAIATYAGTGNMSIKSITKKDSIKKKCRTGCVSVGRKPSTAEGK